MEVWKVIGKIYIVHQMKSSQGVPQRVVWKEGTFEGTSDNVPSKFIGTKLGKSPSDNIKVHMTGATKGPLWWGCDHLLLLSVCGKVVISSNVP